MSLVIRKEIFQYFKLELESLKWQFRKTQLLSYKSSAYEDSVVVDQVARYQQVCC